jgi:hypothetical protein
MGEEDNVGNGADLHLPLIDHWARAAASASSSASSNIQDIMIAILFWSWPSL